MRKIFLLAIAGLLYVGVNAQSQKTGRDTTKQKNKNTRIIGQDSVSRHNADKDQNRKREHKKNIYKDKDSSGKK